MLAIGQGRLSACLFSDKVAEIPAPAAVLQTTRRRSGRPLLVVEGLQKRFGNARACDDVSFSLYEGEILGVVGSRGAVRRRSPGVSWGSSSRTLGLSPLTVRGWRAGCRPASGRYLRHCRWYFRTLIQLSTPATPRDESRSRAVAKLHGERSVDELAREARLEQHHLDVRTVQLSGGLKQRAAIAAGVRRKTCVGRL